ncbi:hypothetical protein PRIPAC_71937 [Pristionchus pacificus]|nr:hypothetical protein PRIPAC_71937 [Pristionchus pacificus]
MVSEDHDVSFDTETYNVSFFVDKVDFILIKGKTERAMLKLDHHRVGPLLIPMDLQRFSDFYERSRLIPCLNKKMKRNKTKEYENKYPLPKHFENKMAELRDALIDMGTMPFITGGTLLGWYRECAIIPHTMDADFGVLRQDYRPRMLQQIKDLPGFDLFKRIGRDYDSLEFTLVAHHGGPIDIFIVYDEDDDHVYTTGLDKPSRLRFKWILPRAKGYCSGILNGRLFFVPCNVEQILRTEYGKEWQHDHPTSKFNWWESSPNVVANGEFTEEEMDKYYIQYYLLPEQRSNEARKASWNAMHIRALT